SCGVPVGGRPATRGPTPVRSASAATAVGEGAVPGGTGAGWPGALNGSFLRDDEVFFAATAFLFIGTSPRPHLQNMCHLLPAATIDRGPHGSAFAAAFAGSVARCRRTALPGGRSGAGCRPGSAHRGIRRRGVRPAGGGAQAA